MCCPSLSITLDSSEYLDGDEIVLLRGCETMFHIRKHLESDIGTYKIVGVCNILLSPKQLNWDESMDIVPQFILQNYPLDRNHLQKMIMLEAQLKRLDCWDSERYQSTDNIICASMFTDNVITQVLTSHAMGGSWSNVSNFKKDDIGVRNFNPFNWQVQWLTTRLKFWDSLPCWDMVDSLGSICPLYVQ
jgi:hypothetical protein